MMETVRRDPCAQCGSIKREHACPKEEAVLDGLVAVGFYHDPRLRTLIHGLKYQSATCLTPVVKDLLRRLKTERGEPWPWAGESALVLQAIVGAADRIRARGFDQAELIRDAVKEEVVPWAETRSMLSRRNSVQPQAELEPGPLRGANVSGVFSLKAGALRSDSKAPLSVPLAILLVDDVFTTGSTMHEAARLLRAAGVQRVYGLVLALGA